MIDDIQDELASAFEEAKSIALKPDYYWGGLQSGCYSAEQYIAIWQEFRDRSSYARMALEFIEKFSAWKKEQSIIQAGIKTLRQEVANNYDFLFVTIGRRDGFRCQMCGSVAGDLQIDHIQPVSKNGGNELGNLQLLCQRCNRRKGNK